MANLVIADVCNLKCAYCFAQDYLKVVKAHSGARFISLEVFEQRLDFLERSGIDEIRLIGGEPTLHPRFPELIDLSRRRRKRIVVFTHGLLSEAALTCLEALPPEGCTILVNMNAGRIPGQVSEEEQKRRLAGIRRLGSRVVLGYNIYGTNFQLGFLLQAIRETNCKKFVRLGLAQPMLSGENVYLHPKQYPVVGAKVAHFASEAAEIGVRLEFDCGFVRCMFSDEQLETLRAANADIGWRCNPILDVDLSGQALHCFPLAGKVQIDSGEGASAEDLRAYLVEQTRLYRTAGIYKECSTCRYKQAGECTGGCLASTIKRFRPAGIRLQMPATRMS